MNKAKISIALTKSLLKQINDECKQTGLSRSSFIEMILRQYYRPKDQKETAVLRAAH
ncbi:MAG TPA: ribbon-helix-helix protein, CopG family [Candidatus Bathyarchaeota archaeon]|nr:ribbon-helix-helix protein, CopG family [Candidatus Bathyarchaeota archaeon]